MIWENFNTNKMTLKLLEKIVVNQIIISLLIYMNENIVQISINFTNLHNLYPFKIQV